MMQEITDREGVRRSIRHIRAVKARERNPPAVPSSEGWSPYAAMRFLKEEGLPTGDYHRTYGGWYAESSYMNISADFLPDHVAYYVEGDDRAAKRLKLVLDVNNLDNSKAADEKFFMIACTLIRKATGKEVGDKLLRRDSMEVADGNKSIALSRDEWQGGIRSGYSRRLVIEHGGQPAE